HAVRRPAGMRDTERSAERLLIERVLKPLHLAEPTQPLERAVVQHGETCRVVASILEAAQSFHQDRRDITLRNRTDDAAHGSNLSRTAATFSSSAAASSPPRSSASTARASARRAARPP